MPTKRSTFAPDAQEESKPVFGGACGHINRHSIGVDGKNDNPACTKDKGHDGNHGAEHKEYVPSTSASGIVLGKRRYEEKLIWREWLDMAGTPVSKITIQPIAPTPEDEAKILLAKMAVGGSIPGNPNVG